MSNAHPASFEFGFSHACELYAQGLTWESISHKADATPRGRGMIAACDAMSGWLDLARREAKAHGVPEATVDELIRLSLDA